MRFCRVGYKWLRNYGDRLENCLLCIGLYEANTHKCEVNRYSQKPKKIYIYIIAWYANCIDNY